MCNLLHLHQRLGLRGQDSCSAEPSFQPFPAFSRLFEALNPKPETLHPNINPRLLLQQPLLRPHAPGLEPDAAPAEGRGLRVLGV